MGDSYNPTTINALIGIGVGLPTSLAPGIDKQLRRFAIADGHSDPQLLAKLGGADPGLLDFLAGQLALAIYNAP